MSATNSTMLPLGTPAPDFTLPDVATGEHVGLADFEGTQALLVIFLCAHCPYVIHVAPELARIAQDFHGKGLSIVGITSNDVAEYPQDAPAPTAEFASKHGFNFPVLFDESQAVAKAYTAACTPDFFLFDGDRKLAYRGQIDSTRPRKGEPNGAELRAAIQAVLSGQPVDEDQKPSIGCNIKWREGNAPSYFGS